MSDPSNPITEPKRLPSRGKRIAEGLLIAGLGAAAWVLFYLIRAVIHVRFLPLPVIGLLMIAAGLFWAFSKEESPSTSDTTGS